MYKFLARKFMELKLLYKLIRLIKNHLLIKRLEMFYSIKSNTIRKESVFSVFREVILVVLMSTRNLFLTNNLVLYIKTRTNYVESLPSKILVSILNGKLILVYENQKFVEKVHFNQKYYLSSLKKEIDTYPSFKQVDIKSNSLKLSIIEPLMIPMLKSDINGIISKLVFDLYQIDLMGNYMPTELLNYHNERELHKLFQIIGIPDTEILSTLKPNQLNIICHGDFTLGNLYKQNNVYVFNDCDFVFVGNLCFDLIYFCINLYENKISFNKSTKIIIIKLINHFLTSKNFKNINSLILLYLKDYYLSRTKKLESIEMLKFIDMRKSFLYQYKLAVLFFGELEFPCNI